MNIATNETDSQPGEPHRGGPAATILLLPMLAAIALFAGCTPAPPPAPPEPKQPAIEVKVTPQDTQETLANTALADRLVGLLSARLKVMHDVARWKWHAQRPIEDLEREALLLAAMEKRAEELKLDPKSVSDLFAAQLTASKLVQQADFERWKATSPPPTDVPDLQRDLRPQIDQLNGGLLECWRDCQPKLAQPEFRAYLLQKAKDVFSQQGIADDIQKTALAPLQDSEAKRE